MNIKKTCLSLIAIILLFSCAENNGIGGERIMNLKETAIGSTVTVARIGGAGAVKRRIMDMGITKGTEVTVRKVAPLGDPIELTVRGYELSIRKADAELIEVLGGTEK